MGFINKHCLAWAGGPGGVTAIFECNYLLEVKVTVGTRIKFRLHLASTLVELRYCRHVNNPYLQISKPLCFNRPFVKDPAIYRIIQKTPIKI